MPAMSCASRAVAPVTGRTLSANANQRGSTRQSPLRVVAQQVKPVAEKVVSHVAAAALTLSVATTPLAALANPDLQLGAEVFSNNCAACHTGGGNTVRPGYTLQKDAINQYLETPVGNGLNVTAIIYQVQTGKGGMPAWEDVLEEDEIESVAAYVYDQASGDKW